MRSRSFHGVPRTNIKGQDLLWDPIWKLDSDWPEMVFGRGGWQTPEYQDLTPLIDQRRRITMCHKHHNTLHRNHGDQSCDPFVKLIVRDSMTIWLGIPYRPVTRLFCFCHEVFRFMNRTAL